MGPQAYWSYIVLMFGYQLPCRELNCALVPGFVTKKRFKYELLSGKNDLYFGELDPTSAL